MQKVAILADYLRWHYVACIFACDTSCNVI